MEFSYLDLVPPLFEAGHVDEFLESGQTVDFVQSSRSNSLAIFPRPLQLGTLANQTLEAEVYIAALNQPPTGERRAFVSDTSVIFNACINATKRIRDSGMNGVQTREIIKTFRKLANDYILHIQDCWIHSTLSTSSRDDNFVQYTGDHYKFLYSTFSLFQLLYLPEEGIENVPVGDELLEWLNTHFIEPSTEEGDRLSGLDRPWEDELFWPYLTRATLRGLVKSSTFFFRGLTNHPSENLKHISDKMVDILYKHPRQKYFRTEKEFRTASRRWKDKVKALRIVLDCVPENDRFDGFENWWENLSDLLGILEGRDDVLQRVCIDLGGSWKEVICVYGIWVDVGLRRSELPEVVGNILLDAPADPTDKEDVLHLELVMGHPAKALTIAHNMDPWLPAHLSDILTAIGLLDSEADDETGMSTRDYYVSSYADYLHSDPGLWRITVVYLCSCSEIGMEMADEVLIRVPLVLSAMPKSKDTYQIGYQNAFMDVEEETQVESGNLDPLVKELCEMCREYQREHARRSICQIAARKLMNMKAYGLALAYCRTADDWTMVGHIVEAVLEEFIAHGPSHYVPLLSDIAPSVRELWVESRPHDIFVDRLKFAVRYADFHRRKMLGDLENALLDLVCIFEEDIAPRAWWGVLLYDTISFLQDDQGLIISLDVACLLLRRLEEITLRTSQGFGDDYLGILARLLKLTGPQEALCQLDVLRLALARHLARSSLPMPTFAGRTSSHEL